MRKYNFAKDKKYYTFPSRYINKDPDKNINT